MEGLLMKYFVLKPKGNDIYAQASRSAMAQYAKIIQRENPEFCKQITDWVLAESLNANPPEQNKPTGYLRD